MASKQFTFGLKREGKQKSSSTENVVPNLPPTKVKSVIQQQLRAYDELHNDNDVKTLIDTYRYWNNQYGQSFAHFLQSEDDNVKTELQQKMNEYTEKKNELKSIYIEILQKELYMIHLYYAPIFEMLVDLRLNNNIEDVKYKKIRTTIEHVLSTFDDVANGKITEKDAVRKGINFMEDEYELPKDYFNKDDRAIEETIKKLKDNQL